MINNPQKFMEGIWNWDFLNEVLPANARISDIDGVLERGGWLLAIETKAEEVQKIPLGQYILYENMVRTGTCSVLFLFGKKDNPKFYQLMKPKIWGHPCKEVDISDKKACSVKDIQKLVFYWYKKADERRVNLNQNIQF